MRKTFVLVSWLIVVFGLALLCSCAGQHCITIGGEYEGVQGNVEYCFDKEQSKQEGIPTFTNTEGKSYLIPEEDIIAANEVLQKAEVVSAKTTSVSPIKCFLERCRKP